MLLFIEVLKIHDIKKEKVGVCPELNRGHIHPKDVCYHYTTNPYLDSCLVGAYMDNKILVSG